MPDEWTILNDLTPEQRRLGITLDVDFRIGVVTLNAAIDEHGNKFVIDGTIKLIGSLGITLEADWLGGLGFIPWTAIEYIEPR